MVIGMRRLIILAKYGRKLRRNKYYRQWTADFHQSHQGFQYYCTSLAAHDMASGALAPKEPRDPYHARKISTYFLRNKCGQYNFDSKTIQRFMNDESVSTYTLNALCNILECDLSDMMEFLPDLSNPKENDEDTEKQ